MLLRLCVLKNSITGKTAHSPPASATVLDRLQLNLLVFDVGLDMTSVAPPNRTLEKLVQSLAGDRDMEDDGEKHDKNESSKQ